MKGTVYRLKPSGADWIFELLHTFTGGPDGAFPQGRVSFGPDGALYGTTWLGGTGLSCTLDGPGCGTIFRLTPRATICASLSCPWTESVLYRFPGGSDGALPSGDLAFDQDGDIYGTSAGGVYSGQCYDGTNGPYGCGTVYELTRSGETWTHTLVYTFQGPSDNYADGVSPASGVILDNAGNLYGTAPMGGVGGVDGSGVAFELSPSRNDWIQSVLYSFMDGSDGRYPYAGLIFDRLGNLYGAASFDGLDGAGTVYDLTPSNGGWSFNLLHTFPFEGIDTGPVANLTMDAPGDLYGTTLHDGANGYGSVFKLSPSSDGWIYTVLHDFTGGADGGYPASNVVLDANGNLYGTALCGGDNSCTLGSSGDGVVWMITPN